MNSINHEEQNTTFVCNECGNEVCSECAVNNDGVVLCKECAEKKGLPIIKNVINNESKVDSPVNNFKVKRKISTFWTTVFSFIPGAGHMYLGLMQRGLQIMFAFFGVIALSNIFTTADFLNPFAVIIWFYSVFDCYHLRKKVQHGENIQDEMIVDMNLKEVNPVYWGGGLIVLGSLILLNELFYQLPYMFHIHDGFVYHAFKFLKAAIFPVALIVFGIVLLRKSRRNTSV
ncbi:hypothetical protein [Caldisalinibacter kiritimatiensis]|uniref:B box-type domain-containing protein n=1 Tax=Caldisalinibacter kiritimatiensis TaxID=1304284 RepID=R1CWD5_9FIRM|nr:hypothetical protein [Caldisalinibacter kiritimatiensis]EOD00939.1 hypothetical protein L21TH_1047 [Caldisalinibacter kiritimatiensis]